jgi:hypothetical protein
VRVEGKREVDSNIYFLATLPCWSQMHFALGPSLVSGGWGGGGVGGGGNLFLML